MGYAQHAARFALDTFSERSYQSTHAGKISSMYMNPGAVVNSDQRGAADTGIEGERDERTKQERGCDE